MAAIWFISEIFVDYIFPFVLVFTLIFAVLQKTKLLGDESKQTNLLISLVSGFILISFPYARYIVVSLVPFLAVIVVILLVFMLLYGFIVGKKDGDILGKGWKNTLIIILVIALVVFLLNITGYWSYVKDIFTGKSFVLVNIILIVFIVGAIIAVLWGEKSGGGS